MHQAIYELDIEGNLIATDIDEPPPLDSNQSRLDKQKKSNSSIPMIKPTQMNNDRNSLRFDEVQEAMMKDTSNYLQNHANEWATPELIEKRISKNSTLMSGFSNPKFKAALEEFQSNPRSTIVKEKMMKDAEFRNFIQELMQVMGNHFIQLGEKQKKTKDKRENASRIGLEEISTSINNGIRQGEKKDLGPYVEKILEDINSKTNESNNNLATKEDKKTEQSKSEEASQKEIVDGQQQDEQVQKILQDKELTQILMDPDFQRIMQECSIPGKMQQHMHHPQYGQKLRKLIEVGLLRFA